MSDEHKQPACPHLEAVGTRWDDAISEERQAKLQELADRQLEWVAQPKATRGESPFKGVELTGADVFWLAKQVRGENGWVPKLHLEGANLTEAHLERANLSEAHLEGTRLARAHLEGTDLHNAHLELSDLREAHLEGASVYWA
ncbi:MAG TPA: pentapeptide repeat-containing protein, partial [Ktedonobacterales bacterium]